MPESPLKIQALSKRYGDRWALSDVSLEIAAGSATGLVGPNGAGKTTLIRLAVGLDRPTEGSVRLFGAPPAKDALSRVGYMTQAEAIYADLTPRENLRFFGALAGLAGQDLDRRIDSVLGLVDLVDRGSDRIETLSGGMRRRASLACAILHDPQLVFLDEPTVGVDPELRANFWDHFLQLKRSGASLLVSTHHLDEARRCDRLVLLKEGRIIADAAPEKLLEDSGASSIEDAFLYFARRRP